MCSLQRGYTKPGSVTDVLSGSCMLHSWQFYLNFLQQWPQEVWRHWQIEAWRDSILPCNSKSKQLQIDCLTQHPPHGQLSEKLLYFCLSPHIWFQLWTSGGEEQHPVNIWPVPASKSPSSQAGWGYAGWTHIYLGVYWCSGGKCPLWGKKNKKEETYSVDGRKI